LDLGPPDSADQIKQNARVIAETIRERDLSAKFDRLRKLPEDVVTQLRAAGIFRMNMPKIWGGREMNPMDQVEVIETLCWGDASVGWCSFIWCDSGIYSGYLDDAVARASALSRSRHGAIRLVLSCREGRDRRWRLQAVRSVHVRIRVQPL
tara:strand:- start:7 stop:459 length:453 start_codon:yes stop_codon:yes gene_type:complete